MKPPVATTVEVKVGEIDDLLAHSKTALPAKEYEILEKLVRAYLTVVELIEDKETTIRHLRKLFFGSKSEKTREILKKIEERQAKKGEKDAPPGAQEGAAPNTGNEAAPTDGPSAAESVASDERSEAKKKGHGRNGAGAYQGAEKVQIRNEALKSGDPCPETGCKGKVYPLAEPKVIVRVTGRAPLGATVYELERLRCNLCGVVFTAKAPAGLGDEKYDEEAASMVALLKYGSGLPFNRLEKLQDNFGIPLPAATQWAIVEPAAGKAEPVYRELIRLAAQGKVLHNDDTDMMILELTGKRRERSPPPEGERKSVFTTGIVSLVGERKVALFFTGPRHAGENLEAVLRKRAADLGPAIQMCDALSRNLPRELQVIVANCLAHARRRFVDVVESFPVECRQVLEALCEVYRNDATARERGLTPEERLRFHRKESWPHLKKLKRWLKAELRERRVEPNSSLGEAITYMLKHWKKLTRFLRVPGAPIDNNVCERALKKVILHRKNAMFYLSANGARVGDIFMSLIHTSELAGVEAFRYLIEIQKHSDLVAADPAAWLPWNYAEALEAAHPG